MFENVDGRTDDGRTDDGRTTDAGVTGILIAHLGAFGSGELKKHFQSWTPSDKNYWIRACRAFTAHTHKAGTEV